MQTYSLDFAKERSEIVPKKAIDDFNRIRVVKREKVGRELFLCWKKQPCIQTEKKIEATRTHMEHCEKRRRRRRRESTRFPFTPLPSVWELVMSLPYWYYCAPSNQIQRANKKWSGLWCERQGAFQDDCFLFRFHEERSRGRTTTNKLEKGSVGGGDEEERIPAAWAYISCTLPNCTELI